MRERYLRVKRPQFRLQLPRWHEWLIYGGCTLLVLSGVAWLLLDRYGKVAGEFGAEPNPALPWLLLVHGTVAYAFTVTAAMLIPVHMRLGWNAGRNRPTGLLLIAISTFLILTGLGLYYSTGEQTRVIMSTMHWVVGLAMPVTIILHLLRGKRSRGR